MNPGIYFNMPAAKYFADPCPEPSLTQSIAKILLEKSPMHAYFKHPRLNPAANVDEDGALIDDEKQTSTKAIGNAAHKIVLGRGKDVNVVMIHKRERAGNKTITSETEFEDAPDFKTAEARAIRDGLLQQGKVPILAKHHKAAQQLAASIREKLDAAGCERAFVQGNAEVVMIARDGDVWLRSMADWQDGYMIYDLKTGGTSAAPDAIPNRIADQGWHIQAAMQERILDLLYPADAGRRHWRFVAVEQSEPFGLTVNELPESTMTIGRQQLDRAIRIWRHCINHCVWPGYPPEVNRPELPDWSKREWLEREMTRNEFDPENLLAG